MPMTCPQWHIVTGFIWTFFKFVETFFFQLAHCANNIGPICCECGIDAMKQLFDFAWSICTMTLFCGQNWKMLLPNDITHINRMGFTGIWICDDKIYAYFIINLWPMVPLWRIFFDLDSLLDTLTADETVGDQVPLKRHFNKCTIGFFGRLLSNSYWEREKVLLNTPTTKNRAKNHNPKIRQKKYQSCQLIYILRWI